MNSRKKILGAALVIMLAVAVGFVFSGGLTPETASAAQKTYTITPKSKPIDKRMMNFGYYNSYTRQYYTVRSYMERMEKEGGGTLVLKKGTYSITNTIFVPSNVTIKLSNGAVIRKGTNTHLKSMPAAKSLFHFIRPSRGQKKSVYGKYNGEKNISLIGSGSATINMSYQANANCIEAGHNQNITIKGIRFTNCNGGHFMELDASKKVTVSDCKFTRIRDKVNVREAINLDTPDKKTGGFTAQWSKFDRTADQNVTIERCVFKNMPRAIGTHNYSYGHPHKNIKIRDCKIKNVKSFGIGMMYWHGVEITGCKIIGAYKHGKGTYDGILGYGIEDVTITDNHIDKFRYAMLFKYHKDNYARIVNKITRAEGDMFMSNTGGRKLAYNCAFVQENKPWTDKIYIDTIQ